MSEVLLLVLKYLSAILATGLAVAGAWFYDFTLPDKDGQRTMTTAGKRAFVVTLLSLAIAGLLTVWEDRDARSKEVAAKKEHELDSQRIARIEEGVSSTNAILVRNIDKLSVSDQQKVIQSLKSFHTPEELQRLYPDLYQRLNKAMFDSGKPPLNDEAKSIFNEAVARGVDARISSQPECAAVKLERQQDTPFKDGQQYLGDSRTLVFLVTNDDVRFGISDASQSPYDFKNGFRLAFDNGAQTENIPCRNTGDRSSCEASTTNPIALQAYKLAQKSHVKEIVVDGGIISLSDKVDDVNKLFRCVEP